jgi:hypothetical protein
MAQPPNPSPYGQLPPADPNTNLEAALANIEGRPCLGRIINEGVNGNMPLELQKIMALQPAVNAQLSAQFEELNREPINYV